MLAGSGCVSNQPKPDTSNLVWPPPPETPRIRYVAEYRGDKDVAERSFKASLLGEERASRSLMKPYGVTASPDGQRILVTDTKAHAVMVFDLQNKKFYPFRTDAMGGLTSPIEVRMDSAGRVYVTDSVKSRLNIYSPQGKTLLSLGKAEQLQRPTGLALDEARGHIYVSDTASHRILIYGMDGGFIREFGERGGEPGQFNFPVNLTVDAQGRLYVVDTGNFRVQIFSPEGEFVDTFGQVGDGIGSLARPKGVALDSEGHVYLVDAAFNNFQIFDREGKILLFVGSLGREPGRFWIPTGIFIDAKDRIYVVDSANARVQVFQYLSDPAAAGQG